MSAAIVEEEEEEGREGGRWRSVCVRGGVAWRTSIE